MSEKTHFIGLKNFRERLKMKQKDLAAALNQSPSNYHHWETGRYEVSFSALQRLFEMGATVEELFYVPYAQKTQLAALKVSKEEATEIVRIGLSGLIGRVGSVRNEN